jgi:hypothetical protein
MSITPTMSMNNSVRVSIQLLRMLRAQLLNWSGVLWPQKANELLLIRHLRWVRRRPRLPRATKGLGLPVLNHETTTPFSSLGSALLGIQAGLLRRVRGKHSRKSRNLSNRILSVGQNKATPGGTV